MTTSTMEGFPTFMFPSKVLRGDTKYFTKDLKEIFSFKVYVNLEAKRSARPRTKVAQV